MFPRLHAMVVHFPVALLSTGTVVALLYLMGWRRSEMATLAWWLLGLGWVGNGLAILSGLLAQGILPPDAPYRGLLNLHITGGFALLAVYGDLLYRGWLRRGRRRSSQRGPAASQPDVGFWDLPERRIWTMVQLLLGLAILAFTGWLGGELVYGWGVGVD